MPSWTSFAVKAGQVLSFDYLQSGARVYIAVSGGVDVPLALGSRSTYPIGALGGFKGRAIAAGDELPVGAARAPKRGAPSRRALRARARRSGRTEGDARPLLAPHHRAVAASTSSRTPGRSRPKPTVSATASAAAGRSNSSRANRPSAPVRTPRTSSTPAIPTDRFSARRHRPSFCIATRFPAAAISCSAP